MSGEMIKLNRFLESTLLKPTMTEQELEVLIRDAREEQFIGVCVPPFWVKKVARELESEDIQTVTVIGFPFGFEDTESKITQTRQAIQQGAEELDLVWNQSAYHSGMNWPKIELAKISNICHEEGRLLKVIIETAYLNTTQLQEACLICQDSGADFVKTSTGYAPAGATVSIIQTMRNTLSSQVGIKASGGIKEWDQALALIKAGADRLGTSQAKYILDTWRKAEASQS